MKRFSMLGIVALAVLFIYWDWDLIPAVNAAAPSW